MYNFNTFVFKSIIIIQMQSKRSDDSLWQYDQLNSYSPVRMFWKIAMLLCSEKVTMMLLVLCSGKIYELYRFISGDGRRMQCIWGEGTEISTSGSGRGIWNALLGLNFRGYNFLFRYLHKKISMLIRYSAHQQNSLWKSPVYWTILCFPHENFPLF